MIENNVHLSLVTAKQKCRYIDNYKMNSKQYIFRKHMNIYVNTLNTIS